MTLSDKLMAAVKGMTSERERQEARARAQAEAGVNDWLAMVLLQHMQVEAAFSSLMQSTNAESKRLAERQVRLLSTAHANAEESILYPALAHAGERSNATASYSEHALYKMNLGELEHLDPMSSDYADKVEYLWQATRDHICDEERKRFLLLKRKTPVAEQELLTRRFKEEFDSYIKSHQ
jgi:hemerythrin HHE cation binding domain-containing protein